MLSQTHTEQIEEYIITHYSSVQPSHSDLINHIEQIYNNMHTNRTGELESVIIDSGISALELLELVNNTWNQYCKGDEWNGN